MRQIGPTGGWGTAATCLLLTACLAATVGCTICPSPFDYSGTVPGAADQNDFRVRNNGILPIWRRPRPWPPVVSNEPRAGTPADSTPAPRRIPAAKLAETENPATASVLLTAAEETPAAADRVGTAGLDLRQEAAGNAIPDAADGEVEKTREPRRIIGVPATAAD